MELIYKLSHNHIHDLHNLYKDEWWTNTRTLEQTKNCVEGSQIVIGLVDNNQLIAFVRVITDYTFKALIFDLIINKNYRHRKLGQKLIQLVKTHEKLKHVLHFELYCLPELKDYYRKFDFTDDIDGIELLRCYNLTPIDAT